jgi:hypothetical protein
MSGYMVRVEHELSVCTTTVLWAIKGGVVLYYTSHSSANTQFRL